MNKTKTIVIYHRADYDGLFCREIARKFLPDAELIGWDYGDPVPTPDVVSADDTLYMLDISVEGLMGHPKLIWIDHHKSAIEKWTPDFAPSTIEGYRIDGVAACRLAWQWFTTIEQHKDEDLAENWKKLPAKQDFIDRTISEPLAVRLAGEYDIWDHRGDGDLEFQFGLDSEEHPDWNELLSNRDDYTKLLVSNGSATMRCYSKRDADIMRARSFTVRFEGLNFLVLNTARCNSNTFAALDVTETGHDALMGFYYNGKGWNFSLYHANHRKDLDLSIIAVKYGGGGHRGACGFRVASLKDFPILA